MLRNSLIARNRFAYFANVPERDESSCGVYVRGGSIENCTIAENRRGDDGTLANRAIYLRPHSSIRNCLFYDNLDYYGAPVDIRTYSSLPINCATLTESGYPGAAVIPVNDIVKGAPPVPVAAGRLHDAGMPYDVRLVGVDTDIATYCDDQVDINGNPRIAGGLADIGCTELQPAVFSCTFTVTAEQGIAPLTVTCAAAFDGDTVGAVPTWIVDDAEQATHGTTLTLALDPGEHTIALRAVNAAGTVAASVSKTIKAAPQTLYVADRGQQPAYPYSSFATAATSIQDAIDAAVDGCEIVITNGVYTPPATLVIDKAVTVRGYSGIWNDVEITGSDARRVVRILTPGAVLASVTIRNGAGGNSDKGYGIYNYGGMVTNCRVTKCLIANYGYATVFNANGGRIIDSLIDGNRLHQNGGAIAIQQADAASLVDRCTITNNYLANEAHVGTQAAVYMTGGTVRNSIIADTRLGSCRYSNKGSGVWVGGGVLENCLVVNNTHIITDTSYTVYGVRAAGGTVRNCVIAGNHAVSGEAADWGGTASAFLNCAIPAPDAAMPGAVAFEYGMLRYNDGELVPPLGSALVDAGFTAGWEATALDYAGLPRLSGTAPDIGPCERQAASFAAVFEADRYAVISYDGTTPFSFTLTPVVEGDPAGATFEWDLDGDGTFEQSLGAPAPVTAQLSACGTVISNVLVTDDAELIPNCNATTRITYSCTYPTNGLGAGCVEATGNVYTIDREGRIRIYVDGPCRDAATLLDWHTGARDLYGNQRIFGRHPDIGCVELQHGGGSLILLR